MQLNRDALLARWRAERLPFLAALGFGLLAHGFLLTNKIPVDDDLPNFFNKGATYVSGRYGLELLRLVMPDVSMPWIYGWMSLALLALAVCVMLRLFRIKSPALRLLLAGVFVTFPAETGTLCYMFTAVPYALALLLTVTGVALFAENRRGRWLLSPLLIAFSCSIYQGYFAFAASFCVILLIRALAVEGKDAKPVLLDGFRLLGMLLLALALYGLAILTAAKAMLCLVIELLYDDSDSTPLIAQFLQSEIENNLPGVHINLKSQPKKSRTELMQNREYQLGLTRWGPDYADPMTYLDMWTTGSTYNYGEWSNEEYDKLIADANGDLANRYEERWEALKQAEALVMEHAVILPVYQKGTAAMVRPGITGLAFFPVGVGTIYKDVDVNF